MKKSPLKKLIKIIERESGIQLASYIRILKELSKIEREENE